MQIVMGKRSSLNKTFFNQLRKKANKLHVPMAEDYLNSITSQIQKGKFDLNEFERRLEHASIFRKIRLAYALKHRIHPKGSIVYRVRNGRGWATEFEWPNHLEKITQQTFDIVLASIVGSIRENVIGKRFFIPPNIHYALPATEKQFTGHLP
ncbi:MAG: hypothetical protein GY757_54515, partial [bacterium]|nr:hypothetical protein [bacterium]